MIFLHTQHAATWPGNKNFDRVNGVERFWKKGKLMNLYSAEAPCQSRLSNAELSVSSSVCSGYSPFTFYSCSLQMTKKISINIVGSPLHKLSGKQNLKKNRSSLSGVSVFVQNWVQDDILNTIPQFALSVWYSWAYL